MTKGNKKLSSYEVVPAFEIWENNPEIKPKFEWASISTGKDPIKGFFFFLLSP